MAENLKEKVRFDPSRPVPQIVYSSPKARVLLLGLEAGVEIPVHPDAAEVLFYVIEGQGTITTGEEAHQVQSGSLVAAPAGAARGIRSQERMTLLALHLG